jgi:hypothetical protein
MQKGGLEQPPTWCQGIRRRASRRPKAPAGPEHYSQQAFVVPAHILRRRIESLWLGQGKAPLESLPLDKRDPGYLVKKSRASLPPVGRGSVGLDHRPSTYLGARLRFGKPAPSGGVRGGPGAEGGRRGGRRRGGFEQPPLRSQGMRKGGPPRRRGASLVVYSSSPSSKPRRSSAVSGS